MKNRRQKRVGNLIKEELSRLFIESIQNSFSGLITITRVEMSADLKSCSVYISIYGTDKKESILELLEKRKGYLRKSIASRVKLKYNPKLIFYLDDTAKFEKKMEELLKIAQKNET